MSVFSEHFLEFVVNLNLHNQAAVHLHEEQLIVTKNKHLESGIFPKI